MNRKFTLVLLVSLLFLSAQFIFAYDLPENEYYLESLRLTKLAQDTFEYGDYDASTGFAEEAIRYARLSDEFVSDQLIIEAKRLLDWADENDIAGRHPNDYNESKDCYEASLEAQSNEDWDEAIASATNAIGILAALESGTPRPAAVTTTPSASSTTLPSQYTVRSWSSDKDCLWNIAGYPWIYGEPEKWRVLYDANKSKFPDPENPNWIEPGIVLDIPSIKGEVRQGMWRP